MLLNFKKIPIQFFIWHTSGYCIRTTIDLTLLCQIDARHVNILYYFTDRTSASQFLGRSEDRQRYPDLWIRFWIRQDRVQQVQVCGVLRTVGLASVQPEGC